MKKKLLICLLVCVGLFVGLTCYAAGNEDPGLQNPNYTAASGYDLTNIEDFVNDGVLTIPANTTIYFNSGGYETDQNYLTNYIVAFSVPPGESFENDWILYYDSSEHILHYGSYSSTCEVDGTVQTGTKITTTEIITGSYDYDLEDIYYYNFSAIVPEGNIAAEIINGTSTLLTSIGVMFTNIFVAAASIVYNNGITVVGWLMLIGLGIALFMFGLRFIKGLINKARAR